MKKAGIRAWMCYLVAYRQPIERTIVRSERENVERGKYPVLRAQIINLFIPTRSPDILADELDHIECLGKHGTVSTVDKSVILAVKYRLKSRNQLFGEISPKMRGSFLEPLIHRFHSSSQLPLPDGQPAFETRLVQKGIRIGVGRGPRQRHRYCHRSYTHKYFGGKRIDMSDGLAFIIGRWRNCECTWIYRERS